jgi:UDP-N-acetylglucosamine 2-epimerase (non-hydrolysing)
MSMPEEINRLVTDRIANLLFAPDEISRENLRREGTEEERVRVVGNIMIDTLEAERQKAAALDPDEIVRRNRLPSQSTKNEPIAENGYAVMTLHRPANVDRPETLEPILRFILEDVCAERPVVWPLHPRTRARLETFDLWETVIAAPRLLLTEPLGYHELLRLNLGARIMLTDSGGLQEECCVLGTPCLTMRDNTERPITLVEHGGVSLLAGNKVARIRAVYQRLRDMPRAPRVPPLWDGRTAERIAAALLEQ